jgi:hypothetical protein
LKVGPASERVLQRISIHGTGRHTSCCAWLHAPRRAAVIVAASAARVVGGMGAA